MRFVGMIYGCLQRKMDDGTAMSFFLLPALPSMSTAAKQQLFGHSRRGINIRLQACGVPLTLKTDRNVINSPLYMPQNFTVKRTTTADPDFLSLVLALDHELWNELNEDQATYDQYNKVPDIRTAVLVYKGTEPVACGCFKGFDEQTVEIKRMFVTKAFRGKGLSKKVLRELEAWAQEIGYRTAVLETSIYFNVAQTLYTVAGYRVTPNYPPYESLPESICMKKELTTGAL